MPRQPINRRSYKLDWDDPAKRPVTSTGRRVDDIAPWLLVAVAAQGPAESALIARRLGVQQVQVKAARLALRRPS
jgi:hypothetical protein